MRRQPSLSSIRVLFGRRLRAIRKLRGLTQEKLGERANVSAKSVSEIERGAGNPTLDLIGRMARSLDVEPWALLRFEEVEAKGPPDAAVRRFSAAERVNDYLARRPAEDLDLALKILEVVLERAATVKG